MKIFKCVKQKIVAILKFLLLALFVVYYSESTLFLHTHHYKYYSVTHSHPYKSDSAGNPIHTHSEEQLLTIHQLTNVVLLLSLVVFVAGLLQFLYLTRCLEGVQICRPAFLRYFSLRAPPVISC